MHLIGVKQNEDWVFSRWNLTYPAGWHNITKAVSEAYEYYENPEIVTDEEIVNIKSKEDIYNIPEDRDLTIRGISKILKVPIMITFYNQVQVVDVNVAKATDEFKETDYEKFNHSLCQYMDSIELTIYR